MASLNKVFLLGNLVRDPDLRGLPSGQSVCELRMAVSRRYRGSNGQDTEETCFVDVVVWGNSAKNCKQYLAKGSQVMVEGRLQLDQWEDRNGGGMRSRLRVIAEQVQFMNRRSQTENSYSQPADFYGVGGMKIFRDLIFQMQGLMREDHRFYKKHGFYRDFPQRHRGKIAAMYLVGAMMNNPRLVKKLGANMTKGMLLPYQRVLDKTKG